MDEFEIPDFSEDDLANDKEIRKSREEAAIYQKMVDDALSIIRNELNVNDSVPVNLKGFKLFSSRNPTIKKSLKSKSENKEVQVFLAEYHSSTSLARYNYKGDDLYLFGHLTVNEHYPETFISEERIIDKIFDVFLKLDVDFEKSKRFSHKFQVFTEDKMKLTKLLQSKDLDPLVAYPEMELEIQKNTIFYRCSRKPISIQEAADFCAMTRMLKQIFE